MLPNPSTFLHRNYLFALALSLTICAGLTGSVTCSAQTARENNRSERSDKITGGRIERAEFDPNNNDLRLTLNVPSFRLTLWQSGKEVKSYFVGVGMKEYPIYIGHREATEVIWNPPWVPPASDWVRERKGVRAGEFIKASDPRNPLGRVKIPLGGSYLIHQAAKPTDIGNLVSHGCIRLRLTDLYDLAEKLVAVKNSSVLSKRIEAAKHNKRTFVVPLDQSVPVDINYDTVVIENRVLHIYPDVYERGTNTPERLRAELESSQVDTSQLDERTIRKILSQVNRTTEFVVEVNSIEHGDALEDERLLAIIPGQKPKTKRQR